MLCFEHAPVFPHAPGEDRDQPSGLIGDSQPMSVRERVCAHTVIVSERWLIKQSGFWYVGLVKGLHIWRVLPITMHAMLAGDHMFGGADLRIQPGCIQYVATLYTVYNIHIGAADDRPFTSTLQTQPHFTG